MEPIVVSLAHQLTGNFFKALPSSLGTQPNYSNTPLSSSVKTYIIRRDNGQPEKYVNVFDTQGNKVYTLERHSSRSKHWSIYNEPKYAQIAGISIGLLERYVNRPLEGTTSLKTGSGVLGKLHRHFFDKRGHLYSWNRRSQNLERISNPNGGHEEHRQTVASISQLRKNSFDWELRIDDSEIDPVLALATAFITLKTQWLISNSVLPGSRHSETESALTPLHLADTGFINNDVERLRVYEPQPQSKAPREFFNPPEFLKHKFTSSQQN